MLYPRIPCTANALLMALLLLLVSIYCELSIAGPHPVKVVEVHRQQSYDVNRLFAGRVVGSQRADIGFEFPGRVARVLVENGQQVKAGEILAELNTDALKIEKREWKAARAEVLARLAQLDKDLRRFDQLSAKGYVSQGQLDELRSRQQSASAQLRQVDEKLRALDLRLSKSRLTAPFTGEIAGVDVEAGEVVQAGMSVLQVVQSGSNEAVFGVSDRLGRDLVIGQTLPVSGSKGNWSAKLIAVSRNLDWRTQTRSIRVELPDSTPLVDGETIHLVLREQRQRPGLWLPMEALVEDVRGSWAVYEVVAEGSEPGRLRKRSVQPLYQYQGQVYVDAELGDGAQVVKAGTHRLAPGQEVVLFSEHTSPGEES